MESLSIGTINSFVPERPSGIIISDTIAGMRTGLRALSAHVAGKQRRPKHTRSVQITPNQGSGPQISISVHLLVNILRIYTSLV